MEQGKICCPLAYYTFLFREKSNRGKSPCPQSLWAVVRLLVETELNNSPELQKISEGGNDGTFDSTDNDTHMRDTSKFSKDEEVLYRCNKFGAVDLRATIVDVHSSDGPPCYYTIKLGQGSERELQTLEDRLSAFEEGYEEKMCKALGDVLANDTCLREMAATGAAEKISSDRTVIGNVTTEAASGLSSNTDLQNDLVGEVAGKVGDLFVNDPNFMDGVGRDLDYLPRIDRKSGG